MTGCTSRRTAPTTRVACFTDKFHFRSLSNTNILNSYNNSTSTAGHRRPCRIPLCVTIRHLESLAVRDHEQSCTSAEQLAGLRVAVARGAIYTPPRKSKLLQQSIDKNRAPSTKRFCTWRVLYYYELTRNHFVDPKGVMLNQQKQEMCGVHKHILVQQHGGLWSNHLLTEIRTLTIVCYGNRLYSYSENIRRCRSVDVPGDLAQ
ncbi:hypothetical protein EVAR_25144_1 [Eumeta japonica]|uniref:Uncharacterized protein n=1 Tax=Eumeta variegata TaxID=151549 RepID=A0A4C1XLV9_EUMVA|nr:hypothetical protein EVAR_25144_1 [Eumeta japonica]